MHGIGRHAGWPGDVVQLEVAALYTSDRKRKNVERASEARIAGQRFKEHIGSAHPLHHSLEFAGRQKQQAIVLEEIAAARLAHGAKQVGARPQSDGELGCRLFGVLWRGRVDDNENVPLRKFP